MAAHNRGPERVERVEDHSMKTDTNSEEKCTAAVEIEEKDSQQVVLDYAGSAEKTDPKEIALVRKLDMIFLVSAEDTIILYRHIC